MYNKCYLLVNYYAYKEKLEEVKGVTEVTWLDDAVDITVPLDTLDQDTVEPYYTDRNALFTVTIQEP